VEKYAFRMQLKPGCAEEYKRRHDAVWPELAELLKSAGISDYSIHLDPETLVLFAVLWRRSTHTMDYLPLHPLMRRWWVHMADLMLTKSGGEPLAMPLETVFHLL
jgi:L-rhamnose mutarotase